MWEDETRRSWIVCNPVKGEVIEDGRRCHVPKVKCEQESYKTVELTFELRIFDRPFNLFIWIKSFNSF